MNNLKNTIRRWLKKLHLDTTPVFVIFKNTKDFLIKASKGKFKIGYGRIAKNRFTGYLQISWLKELYLLENGGGSRCVAAIFAGLEVYKFYEEEALHFSFEFYWYRVFSSKNVLCAIDTQATEQLLTDCINSFLYTYDHENSIGWVTVKAQSAASKTGVVLFNYYNDVLASIDIKDEIKPLLDLILNDREYSKEEIYYLLEDCLTRVFYKIIFNKIKTLLI
jgi:hypothetical protein